MEQNILSDIERLKHDYADLKAEIHELSNAFNQAQVSNSRKRGVYTSAGATCEAMLKFIYQKDSTNQKPANKMMLDELLIKVADELPVQVMINFRTIQAWRNLGTHDKDDMRSIDGNSLIMVDIALSNIVNWFFSSYLKIDTPFNKPNAVNQKIEPNISDNGSKKNKTTAKKAINAVNTINQQEIKAAPAVRTIKPTPEKKIKSIPKKQVVKVSAAKVESTKSLESTDKIEKIIEIRTSNKSERIQVAENDLDNSLDWESAADACQKLEFGWRLPTKSELKLMYKQLYLQDIGNLKNVDYWSCEMGADRRWAYFFQFYDGGRPRMTQKNNVMSARAVRSLKVESKKK